MITYYHGTTSAWLRNSITSGIVPADRIWVGYSQYYCARRARWQAARHGSHPLLLRFDGRHRDVRIEALEEHARLTGHFTLRDLVFVYDELLLGDRGRRGLAEVAGTTGSDMVQVRGEYRLLPPETTWLPRGYDTLKNHATGEAAHR